MSTLANSNQKKRRLEGKDFITNEELNSNGVFYPGGNSAGQTAGPADLRHNRKHLRFVTLTSLPTTTCGLYPNSSNPKKVKSCFPSPG